MSAVNLCQELNCRNVQNAICLHCTKRLCINHIKQHAEHLLDEANSLCDQLNELTEYIAVRSTDTGKAAVLEQLHNWRITMIDEVEKLYMEKLQYVEQHDTLLCDKLNQFHQSLDQRLAHIRIPLEHLHAKQTTNQDELNHIRQNISRLEAEIDALQWQIDVSTNRIDLNRTMFVTSKQSTKMMTNIQSMASSVNSNQIHNSPIPPSQNNPRHSSIYNNTSCFAKTNAGYAPNQVPLIAHNSTTPPSEKLVFPTEPFLPNPPKNIVSITTAKSDKSPPVIQSKQSAADTASKTINTSSEILTSSNCTVQKPLLKELEHQMPLLRKVLSANIENEFQALYGIQLFCTTSVKLTVSRTTFTRWLDRLNTVDLLFQTFYDYGCIRREVFVQWRDCPNGDELHGHDSVAKNTTNFFHKLAMPASNYASAMEEVLVHEEVVYEEGRSTGMEEVD
ncbi:unnamed protein product [Didymodactylos carnosus]|uniref:Uncharacterized protein n=1 Tax=Didymodactylos carnosus TaxID=1234261 RepID=A0A815FDK9_9BILA|nr:unnamed protein product [Didymodactylos carnosus]CAF1324003.1 unnamed protein product [Didymodactylos carnosus]CAF3931611.1 unnamed protein product [Didymodactylos carnosus]CAF4172286.1 unnamed protein product [Didymodactylos carnosus]